MTATLPVHRPGAAAALPPVGDDNSSTGRSAGLGRRHLGRLAPWLVRGVLGMAVLAFAFLAVGPHVLGYRTMTMLTGSMAPEINPGDVTVVTPLAVSDVTEGMVITYHMPVGDHSLVTHRVISVEEGPGGTVNVQTKGEANDAAVPRTAANEGGPAYRVRAVVPEFVHLIDALRPPVVPRVLPCGAAALLAGWV